MTHELRLQRSIQLQMETNARVEEAEKKAKSKPGHKPPSKIPAKHRVMMVIRQGVYEFADLEPTEEATDCMLINGEWWNYAGCQDGVAVYNQPSSGA
jgi:hypothetical protein